MHRSPEDGLACLLREITAPFEVTLNTETQKSFCFDWLILKLNCGPWGIDFRFAVLCAGACYLCFKHTTSPPCGLQNSRKGRDLCGSALPFELKRVNNSLLCTINATAYLKYCRSDTRLRLVWLRPAGHAFYPTESSLSGTAGPWSEWMGVMGRTYSTSPPNVLGENLHLAKPFSQETFDINVKAGKEHWKH